MLRFHLKAIWKRGLHVNAIGWELAFPPDNKVSKTHVFPSKAEDGKSCVIFEACFRGMPFTIDAYFFMHIFTNVNADTPAGSDGFNPSAPGEVALTDLSNWLRRILILSDA